MRKTYVIMLGFLLAILSSGCDKEDNTKLEDSGSVLAEPSQETPFGSVSMEEAKSKLNGFINSKAYGSHQWGLKIDMSTLRLENVYPGIEEKMALVDVQTDLKGYESSIFIIKANNTLDMGIMYLSNASLDSQTAEGKSLKARPFMISTLEGELIEPDPQLTAKGSSLYPNKSEFISDPCPPSICGIHLDEVVVTAPSHVAKCYICPKPGTLNGLWGIMDIHIYQYLLTMRAFFEKGRSMDDKIDDNQLRPCMKAILTQLRKIRASPGSILMRFDANRGKFKYNWKVKDGKLPVNVNARTSTVISGGYATTTFDASKFKDATDLSVARTILHESVHAFLVAEYKNDPTKFNKTYSQLLKDYNTGKRKLNGAHHEEFTRKFVKYIGGALESYGLSKGYKQPRSFYNDLAWGGLEDTDAFKKLPKKDRIRISNTVHIEQYKKDKNGNTKTQKGKKSGC